MERCYFNSCMLNDNYYLSKYRKHFTNKEGKLTKELFKPVDIKDPLNESLNLIITQKEYIKKVIFCSGHYQHLQELLKIIEKIKSSPENIPKETLISLNKIIKNDIDIKKILYNTEFPGETSIIKLLMKNFVTTNNKDNKLYILLNINHLIKENIIKRKDNNTDEEKETEINERHLDNEIFLLLCKEISGLKLFVYDLNQKKVNPLINDENLLRDVLIYDLCLNNIECLFNNWNKKKDVLDLKKTQQLVQNVTDILCQITSSYKLVNNKIICNELFYNIISFLNVYLLSEIKNFDLVFYLINFFVKMNQHIYGYLNEYKSENFFKSTSKNFVTILNTILENMIRVSLREMEKDNLENFLKNSENFNKEKKYELLFYKNNDLIGEIKEKVRLTFINKNNNKGNIVDEE